mmetsp:Transcript_5174/g.8837  ORF Transcript_5174/g.8837 Transcript_5174/m.8837 type:complete len:742 (+) Transcript_5174:103-2328(+)
MASFSDAARFLLLTVLGIAGNLSTADAAGWRSDLDWAALTSKLSSSASLIDTSYQNVIDECGPEFSEPSPTNHALIDQPSGMCLPHKYLGWEMSWPRPSENGHLNQTFAQALTDIYVDPSYLEGWMLDPTNPSLNLPYKVLFPSIASDVVAAVNFAKEHGLEISVKNSGHSYQGASSKKDTLLLNMNRYTHYAPTGITDCDASILGSTVTEDLSNQPCLLSLAKNKSSLIRVGGGENFDKVYRAVIAANEEEGYKYHVVGGAAGTVSPMGWSWQGGLGGTTGGRLYGFGVDQVVQLEMVLPNGVHVKFGPTEWEDASAEGFIVPKTKVVTGVCRSNPDEHDEEKWIWERCPEDFDIDFNDLWFAVRGGGGGTWGVVTSVFLQLHDYLPVTPYFFNLVPSPTEECSAIAPQFAEFKAQYISAPSLLNVTKEHSLACGSPDVFMLLMCIGEEDVMQAWTRFLDLNNSTDPAKVACLSKLVQENNEGVMQTPKGYAEGALFGDLDRFPGKVRDAPAPSWQGNQFGVFLVPQSFLDESEENVKYVLESADSLGTTPYYAFGGGTVSGSDQANSLSQAHRNAAFMADFNDDYDYFWGNLFPRMFDVSDKTKFPPVFGSNHAGFLTAGPLKEDWTKPCPPEWTFEERREKCISFQEAIYGTERLARLEAIKKAVDPQFIFNCANCIGNNLPEASKSQDQDDEPSPSELEPLAANPSDEPSRASSMSSFAAVTSAIAIYLLIISFSCV